MEIIPYLKTQAEFVQQIKARMRDTTSARWTAAEIYNAINDGVGMWGPRVVVPFLYTLPGGFALGDFDYSLPWYISGNVSVQQKRVVSVGLDGRPLYGLNSPVTTWVDVPGFDLEPDGAGGQVLRLAAEPWAVEGRVIWWAQNGPVPGTVQALKTSILATDTSLTITGQPTIGPAGFVKIELEWMQYAGYTQSGTDTTLTNLIRGVNGTTAAPHTAPVNVYWGLAVLRQDLYQQLFNQIYASLHTLFLTNAAPAETQNHIFQVRWHKQLADEFWRGYVPPVGPKLQLTRQGMGRIGQTGGGLL